MMSPLVRHILMVINGFVRTTWLGWLARLMSASPIHQRRSEGHGFGGTDAGERREALGRGPSAGTGQGDDTHT